MDTDDRRKRETEALIEAIWGPQAAAAPPPLDSGLRARQNLALASAMRDYLQEYLVDMELDLPFGRAGFFESKAQ